MTRGVVIAIDQGTTSSRALAFAADGRLLGTAQREFTQFFPADAWVEHDPQEIWDSTVASLQELVATLALTSADIAAIGITNQRETTLVWDRVTGEPVYRAIVWQDRRTADVCAEMRQAGAEAQAQAATGLLLDPYFSATKVAWILDQVDGARARAEAGELAFGTVDCYLIWRLTGGRRHVTDATNASRTLLFNIHTQQWDEDLLKLFRVPAALLPEVLDCAADFGTVSGCGVCEGVKVAGVAGDQQAALIGQACLRPGEAKSTYGTGCFLVLNTGDDALVSGNRLLTTVGYRLAGRTTYALEGSIFVAGAAVQWLRDSLRLVEHAGATEAIAADCQDAGGVYLVPAFTGLGAPHWEPNARGALLGLTRDSGLAQVVTATLQSVGYQTRDLLEAMAADGTRLSTLKVDGGMTANNWMLQFLADILGIPVIRPILTETTALGVAALAGWHQGVFDTLEQLPSLGGMDRRFDPSMAPAQRERLYAGWQQALSRVLG